MIPVVDCNWHPDVAISSSAVVHLLKCVYIQPKMQASLAADDLEKVRELAVTPGLGGLPQGIVAWCDLSPQSIYRLTNTSYVTGLNVSVDSIEALSRCLEAVKSRNQTVDLDWSGSQPEKAAQALSKYPEVPVVLDYSQFGFKGQAQLEGGYQETLKHFHSLDNVSVKITGIDPVFNPGSESAIGYFIKDIVSFWGSDRVMLASHSAVNSADTSFDQLWMRYGQETLHLPTRERESVLRSNAIRIYGL